MSYESDGHYVVHRESRHRARKDHACAACRDTISAGHVYACSFIVFDGDAEYLKRCLRCQTLHEHLRDLCGPGVWPDERLMCGLSYEDEWGELPEEIAALAFVTPDEMQAQEAAQ